MAGPVHHVYVCDDPLSRAHARRMSRRFAAVGVLIDPGRLQQIAAGADTIGNEYIDVTFAMVAMTYAVDNRSAKRARARRQTTRGLLVAGMVVLSLCMLIAMAVAILSMVQPTFTGG
ncbi:MAG: hypothetical protein P4L86_04095 [Mycobacterium sp.]|nr:hypothetical protein [Mycobacterium sp.]